MARKNIERQEAIIRIGVFIVSGVILLIWRYLILMLMIVNWFVVIFTGKRERGLANFSEYWNTEFYRFARYMTFETNKRPFPFTPLKRIGKFER